MSSSAEPATRAPLYRRASTALYRMARWAVRRLHSVYAALGLFLAIALVLMIGAIWGFAELAETVARGQTRAFDDAVLLAIHGYGSARLDSIALQVTVVGNGFVVGVMTLVVCSYLWVLRYRLAMVTLAIGVIGADLLQSVLKAVFQRPRPDLFVIATPYARPVSTSFPSGHATGAIVLYLLLSYFLIRFGGRGIFRIGTVIAASVMIVGIGFSRMYLGVHYPSDVAAGYLIGIAWVAFCIVGSETVQRLLQRSRQGEPMSTAAAASASPSAPER